MPATGKILSLLFALFTAMVACKPTPQPAPLVTDADFDRAEYLLYKNNDSAFYLFNKVATNSKDSLEVAMSFNCMAIIQFDAGDYFGSQETLLAALQYLNRQKTTDHYCLMAVYNLLGSNSLNLKNFDAAIGYYNEAIPFIEDEHIKTVALNNLGVAYQKKRAYTQSIAIFQSILEKSKADSIEYARVLSNLAKARWELNPRYNAAPDLKTALRIRTDKNDDWGLNASYAHLSDYYSGSKPDSAFFFARKMYTVARQLNSADDKLEALQKMLMLSALVSSQAYFAEYQRLSDSLQTARNAAKNQFALVRYETEKSKADNLRLQNQNAEQEMKLFIHRGLIVAITVLFLLILWIGIAWYRKRRQQLSWEHSQEIREQQLKTSRKVHDVVANGLYRLMTEIDHERAIEKPLLLDKIEILYEKSRDISYESPVKQSPLHDFQRTLHQLLNSFSTDTIKVLVVGNEESLWQTVSTPVKTEMEHILQELMINMKKHSQAKFVTIKFSRNNNQLITQYVDDGIGFPDEFTIGNGLRSTENRILGLHGAIIFDQYPVKGVKIQVQIPID